MEKHTSDPYPDFPAELKKCPCWVCWRSVPAKPKNKKIPINPKTGKEAKANDSSTWASYAEALQRLSGDKSLSGIGFEFSRSGPYTGIDLDHCLNPETGELLPVELGDGRRLDPLSIIDGLRSYTEVSPSGTGFHVILMGSLPESGRKKLNFECYGEGRFFTVTGDHWGGTPKTVESRQAELEALHRTMFLPKGNGQARPEPGPRNPFPVTDQELIEKACSASNGDRFAALWRGDTSFHGGDDSSADLALCNLLAFWTNGDEARMDSLFRQSGLMRDKWGARHGERTYGEMTIAKSLASWNGKGYQGKNPNSAGFAGSSPRHIQEKNTQDSNSAGFAGSSPRHIQENIEWVEPEPLPDELSPVIKFHPEWLPVAFQPWVKDISERMQAPIDYPAIGAMVTLSSLVARQVGIRPKRKDDWLVIPNLWGAVVGRPSLMKSPVLNEVMKPLTRLEVEAKQEFESQVKEFEIESMIHTARKKQLENKFRDMIKKGSTPVAAAFIEELTDPNPPTRKRYIINDSTVEKLGELLNENPNGLLVFRDELVGFLRSLDKEGRESERAFYLESWNGNGRFTYDRIGRGTVDIESTTVSLLGGIQPGPLGEYVRGAIKGGKGDDGLLQRFQLLAWPDSPGEWVNVDEWPNKEAKNQAFAVFQRLANIPRREGEDIPYRMFTSDAQNVFNDWREDLENRIRSEEHPAIESHLAKYRSLIPSLALLVHLADSDQEKVDVDPLVSAIGWGSYLESHARRLYGFILYSEIPAAKSLLRHIQQGDLPDPFKVRHVCKKGWSGLTEPPPVEKALEMLGDHGYIALVEDELPLKVGRKPAPSYRANPNIFLDIPSQGPGKTGKKEFES